MRDIVLWTPSHEREKAGRPARTYILELCANTGYSLGRSCSLQFCYEFVVSHFLFSFYSPYVILPRIVLLIPLKYHTGNQSCRLLQYNIITTKPIGPYLPLSRGMKESDLVGVWIVWNLEPLASSGQSGPKLIPHVICQFLYAWEKNSERGLIL